MGRGTAGASRSEHKLSATLTGVAVRLPLAETLSLAVAELEVVGVPLLVELLVSEELCSEGVTVDGPEKRRVDGRATHVHHCRRCGDGASYRSKAVCTLPCKKAASVAGSKQIRGDQRRLAKPAKPMAAAHPKSQSRAPPGEHWCGAIWLLVCPARPAIPESGASLPSTRDATPKPAVWHARPRPQNHPPAWP